MEARLCHHVIQNRKLQFYIAALTSTIGELRGSLLKKPVGRIIARIYRSKTVCYNYYNNYQSGQSKLTIPTLEEINIGQSDYM